MIQNRHSIIHGILLSVRRVIIPGVDVEVMQWNNNMVEIVLFMKENGKKTQSRYYTILLNVQP